MLRASPSGLVDLSGRAGKILRKVDGVCTWCGLVVERPRRTWCSQECVDAYWLTQPAHQRSHVEDRDRGICRACGFDSRLAMELRNMQHHYGRPELHRDAARHAFELYTRGRDLARREHEWDLDHVVPIVDGGDPHDPENWQTLCVPCHKATTAREASARAARRRTDDRQEALL